VPNLLLATRNPGKIAEITAILEGIPMRIISLADIPAIPEVEEDGSTLEQNALKKARFAFAATRFPSLSDDSGLEVYSLNMAPGVRSARYSGEEATYEMNNEKLLEELSHLPDDERKARFRCVAAYVDERKELVTEGACHGTIARACRGDGGFGYDPLFVPDGHTLTFAELSSEVKNSMSHRARAFRAMRSYLMKLRD
jgi:XTP/dITP diphosphohydrolase